MSVVVVLGWWCALIGSVTLLPQTLKLLRDRDTAGISAPFWQIILGATLAWAHHGFLLAAPNMMVPNLVMATVAATTLALVCRDRGLSPVRPFAVALALTAVLIATDLLFGAVAFGLLVMVPGLVGAGAQLAEILRAPTLTGVSTGFLTLTVVLQVSWLAWGGLVGDPSTVMNSGILSVFAVATLVAYAVRVRHLAGAGVAVAAEASELV